MKVLVTGATGFVGQRVVHELASAGHQARILVRKPFSGPAKALVAQYRIEEVAGDVSDPGSLREAVKGTDAIIHLVGIISEAGQTTFENVHTRGTQNMVTAARECGVERFVHMSALGTRAQAASRYHQTKWAAEEAVRRDGHCYTIFRPSLIYGASDHFVNLFARMARWTPILPVMGNGQARFQPVSLEVVAKAFSRALTEDRSIGQTYDLCGAETFTFLELLDQILLVTGHHRIKVRIPMSIAWLQAVLLEWWFAGVLRRPPPLNRDQLVMLQEDNVGNADPANAMFGLAQPAFREGIRTFLKR